MPITPATLMAMANCSSRGSLVRFFEGFASLNLAMADDDNVGDAYRFWYDRHVGTASTQRTSDAERFDHDRAGTVWSLLFYDESGNSANPQSMGFTAV